MGRLVLVGLILKSELEHNGCFMEFTWKDTY